MLSNNRIIREIFEKMFKREPFAFFQNYRNSFGVIIFCVIGPELKDYVQVIMIMCVNVTIKPTGSSKERIMVNTEGHIQYIS